MMRFLVYALIFGFALSFNSCASRVVVKEPTTTVAVVKKLPRQYKIVQVKGKRYYFFNGKHYKKTRKGYIFVRV